MMHECVKVELEIIQDELKLVGAVVPLKALQKWSIHRRAQAEQWAIKQHWSKIKHPPCPKGHSLAVPPVPAVVKRWLRSASEPMVN